MCNSSSSWIQSLWKRYDTFLFARTTTNARRIVTWMRIVYALLYLYDGYVWSHVYQAYFHPTHGLVSYAVGRQSSYFQDYSQDDSSVVESLWNVFQLAPDSETWIWIVFGVAMLHATLLLLGIFPRFQLLGLLVHQKSLHHHNRHLWDAQDVMLRLWTWMLLLMPHNDNSITTISSWFQRRRNSNNNNSNSNHQKKRDDQKEEKPTETTVPALMLPTTTTRTTRTSTVLWFTTRTRRRRSPTIPYRH